MLVFVKGEAKQTLVTLNEKKTLSSPYYLFVFSHLTVGEVVKVVVNSTSDLSAYPDRYNLFNIDTVTLFASKSPGQWYYEVYEQADQTTTTAGKNLVECGKMLLKETRLIKQGYEPTTNYNGYSG